jgi:hypothetical protein
MWAFGHVRQVFEFGVSGLASHPFFIRSSVLTSHWLIQSPITATAWESGNGPFGSAMSSRKFVESRNLGIDAYEIPSGL